MRATTASSRKSRAIYFDPKVWENDALFLPQTRERSAGSKPAGLTDAVRADGCGARLYVLGLSGRRLAENNGIRIDHLMLSPGAADRMTSTAIEKHVRAWEKPSRNHVTCHSPISISRLVEGAATEPSPGDPAVDRSVSVAAGDLVKAR